MHNFNWFITRLKRGLGQPRTILYYLFILSPTDHIPDERFLKQLFWLKMGKPLNLDDPKTFNEKLQWLKLHNRRPEYTTMVDKYAVKQLVADQIGEEYVVPVYGLYRSFDEIDPDALPEQFVLKCTHDSGGLVICKDKSTLDWAAARKKLEKSLSKNCYLPGREWPYKDVPPRILAEKYLATSPDAPSESLPVYKFFCFNGEPRIVQVIMNDKRSNETVDYYDMNWQHLQIRQGYPNSSTPLSPPPAFRQMQKLSQILCGAQPFLRVDWYDYNGQAMFSEFTFYSDSGFCEFDPTEMDAKLGEQICLDNLH